MVRARLGFGKEDRLRRRTDFLRVYGQGRRIHGRAFVLFYAPGGTPRHRIGLTVPRRAGDAVARNRVKRRLRDIFRRNRERLGDRILDVVMNVSEAGARTRLAELEVEFLRVAEAAREGRGKPPRGPRERRRPGPKRPSPGARENRG